MAYEIEDEPAAPDADELLRDLRRQLDAVKARMAAHREVMWAAGLTFIREDPDPTGVDA